MRSAATLANVKCGAGLAAAVGLFLLFGGAATAVLSLLASVGGEPSAVSAGALANLHVVGLIAGLVGGVLLLAGLGMALYLLVTRVGSREDRRSVREES